MKYLNIKACSEHEKYLLCSIMRMHLKQHHFLLESYSKHCFIKGRHQVGPTRNGRYEQKLISFVRYRCSPSTVHAFLKKKLHWSGRDEGGSFKRLFFNKFSNNIQLPASPRIHLPDDRRRVLKKICPVKLLENEQRRLLCENKKTT